MIKYALLMAFSFIRADEFNWQCGLKPLPPLGCKNDQAVCICSQSGCEWVWICK